MTKRHEHIVEALRRRVQAGVRAGTLAPGDRLPSTRDLGATFDVDPRSVLAAYRVLAAEGVVELRERSGVFVAESDGAKRGAPIPPVSWLADVLAQAVSRGVAAPALGTWLRRAQRHPLRAAAIATTGDQLYGLCRELADDFGLQASSVPAERALRDGRPPEAIRAADVLVTTEVHSDAIQRLARRLGKPCVVVRLRDDLVVREWRALLEEPVYVVVEDARFVDLLRGFFAGARNGANVRPVVLGRDDVAQIPATATVYITQAARHQLGDTVVPGTLIAPTRLFSLETAREILELIVRANLEGES
jgi:DNA-binding transcriptional regulator YhcF (GntR family)